MWFRFHGVLVQRMQTQRMQMMKSMETDFGMQSTVAIQLFIFRNRLL